MEACCGELVLVPGAIRCTLEDGAVDAFNGHLMGWLHIVHPVTDRTSEMISEMGGLQAEMGGDEARVAA